MLFAAEILAQPIKEKMNFSNEKSGWREQNSIIFSEKMVPWRVSPKNRHL
jgi:exoribonuclease II